MFFKYNQEIVDCVGKWDCTTGQASELQSAVLHYCSSGEGRHSTQVSLNLIPCFFPAAGAAFPASVWPWEERAVGLAKRPEEAQEEASGVGSGSADTGG